MLNRLTIQDVVLIDHLTMEFGDGLCVLSGETGAGKSILMNALCFVTGARGDSEIVRPGTTRAQVTAEFSLGKDAPALAILDEHEIEAPAGALLLRRSIDGVGRGRAWINDQQVSVRLLRSLGEELLEVHGQNDGHGLLNPATHMEFVDAFDGLSSPGGAATEVRQTYASMTGARKALSEAEQAFEQHRADEEYLRHVVDELDALAPQAEEEAELADRRIQMQQGEKIATVLENAIGEMTKRGGMEATMRGVMRRLERLNETTSGLDETLEAFELAVGSTAEATAELLSAQQRLTFEADELERTEERLFSLRAAARKHGCSVEQLPQMQAELHGKLLEVEQGEENLAGLRATFAAAKEAYRKAAEQLSADRHKACRQLDKAINRELAPLKLDRARFRTAIDIQAEEHWSSHGMDHIHFEITTNPSAPFGPLNKIASGGEMSRIMLALKVAAVKTNSEKTLVFDEIDQGIGGAAAHAVGERLRSLSLREQVLVVTHSPQIAAKAAQHWLISKSTSGLDGDEEGFESTAEILDVSARLEEIARMLSGAKVTSEARLAAAKLIDGGTLNE